jgi:hypothetical protein
MAMVSDVRTVVADMLKRSDLNSEIDREIMRVCESLERLATWVTERAEWTLTTVAATEWYSTVDLSSSAGLGTNDSATLAVNRILSIDYLEITPGSGGIDYRLREVSFRRFKEISENNTAGGYPDYYTRYAARIGLWPEPSDIFTIEGAGHIKPAMPTAANSVSVYFDEMRDYVETETAGRVALKYIRDMDNVQRYLGHAAGLLRDAAHENAKKQLTGKIRPRT